MYWGPTSFANAKSVPAFPRECILLRRKALQAATNLALAIQEPLRAKPAPSLERALLGSTTANIVGCPVLQCSQGFRSVDLLVATLVDLPVATAVDLLVATRWLVNTVSACGCRPGSNPCPKSASCAGAAESSCLPPLRQ